MLQHAGWAARRGQTDLRPLQIVRFCCCCCWLLAAGCELRNAFSQSGFAVGPAVHNICQITQGSHSKQEGVLLPPLPAFMPFWPPPASPILVSESPPSGLRPSIQMASTC
ncbi:uncharacterized protein PG986_001268 [Apiospora aurea]|uniref:Secreted protein n=1 Tax=Apiospora aurea TaxID=335848 RepID=A0ABR1QXC5_9PEZI